MKSLLQRPKIIPFRKYVNLYNATSANITFKNIPIGIINDINQVEVYPEYRLLPKEGSLTISQIIHGSFRC